MICYILPSLLFDFRPSLPVYHGEMQEQFRVSQTQREEEKMQTTYPSVGVANMKHAREGALYGSTLKNRLCHGAGCCCCRPYGRSKCHLSGVAGVASGSAYCTSRLTRMSLLCLPCFDFGGNRETRNIKVSKPNLL